MELLEGINLNIIGQGLALILATIILLKITDKIIWQLGIKIIKLQVIFQRLQIIIRFFVYGLTAYIGVFQILKPAPEALIGLLGGTAVAVGFGARDYLANLLAGIIILFERPFQVGDRIEVEGYAGEVVDINARSFRLRTVTDNKITVPNSTVLRSGVKSINIGNIYAPVEIEFFLAPTINLKAAREILIEAAVTSSYYYGQKPVEVLVAMERFHIRYSVLAYVTDLRNEWEFRSDVTGRAVSRFQELGVTFWVKPAEALYLPD